MTWVGVPRQCARCKADVHGKPADQPHLCADLAVRLVRRQRQVDAVIAILRNRRMDDGIDDDLLREAAEDIVKKLANLGVEND